ncbi:MAG: His/Gly/Thr/Pro-type tRNA ligase C-terminal domain-containing protein [Patescibacteria group bacterium]|nr:His/Gly/Thr/Pro-type tRNA ligase C-terminal domain-containing protein [Patescibacteria group bacterium]
MLVEVYPEVTKIQKQFKYANKKGYQWVIMIGQNEHEQGGFLLKNMTSGEQILCQNISDLISAIAISTS